ncbi:MAG: DUF1028 domain-containing protein [Alphaproteobacteria bacterium]|nr:DUF1028 domain-containing protein [Alphaproteobacteria bacterium]
MTFSIIARDPETDTLGVATATGKLAVGAQVPHLRPGIGAIATQGFTTNPLYAEDGFKLLEAGWRADEVVEALTRRDNGRDWRQVIIMDRHGRTAGFTGDANEPAFRLSLADNLAIAGNMLASQSVLTAMENAFVAATSLPLAARLLEALTAGEHAGGDKRGTRSAALLAEDKAGWLVDLRVDFDDQPIAALADLHQRSREQGYMDFRASLPTRSNPHGH